MPVRGDREQPGRPAPERFPDSAVEGLITSPGASRERHHRRDCGGHLVEPERLPDHFVSLGVSQRRPGPCGLLLRRDLDPLPLSQHLSGEMLRSDVDL